MNNYSHLTSDDRFTIQSELANHSSLNSIAFLLGKNVSTISREIRRHLVKEKKGARGRNYNACAKRFKCTKTHICSPCNADKHYKKCSNCRLCNSMCPEFEEVICPKLQKPPYVCNSCGKQPDCTLKKAFYRASTAQETYETTRKESRAGFALSEKEIENIDGIITPLIEQNQSIHHICATNSNVIMISESTIYRMIDKSMFTARNIDLPRKVRLQVKKCSVHKKVDPKCREGRTYEDFRKFREEHPDLSLVELDSVEGIKGGKVLLTVHFVKAEMMLAFIRDHNDSQSVIEIFRWLYEVLGPELFSSIFQVCLADNGSEFSNPTKLEYADDGTRRTRVYYCDPGRPDQKGSAERNHEFIRYFVKKGESFDEYEQEDISLMMDHINSYHRESIGGKAPYEMFGFMYGEKALELLGCHLISPNEVTLKKSVFHKEAGKE